MKRTPLKRSPMQHKRHKPSPEHIAATRLARDSACLLCGKVGTCVPAHFPRHRGSGGRFENDWDRQHWVPLCGEPGACHDYTDGRSGGVTAFAREMRESDRALLLAKAEREWWR